jgi:hypothetical protein
LWLVSARRSNAVASDLEAISNTIDRHPSRIIVAVALISGATAAGFSTRSAAGADASGYISEAAMLVRGELFHHDDLFDLTKGNDAYLSSPLGWRPAPSGPRQSPTYPPGLPLLMAVPHAIAGTTGAAAVVVASAIATVIATALIAMRLGGATAGILAACLIAFTPIFIHQSIQPMSDVPVTAAWALCFLFAMQGRSTLSGLACACAALIRPNLAPLAIVPLFVAPNRVAFALPVGTAGAVLAGFQWAWYGSPLRNGYGSAEQLFALGNMGPNLGRYARWGLSTAPVFVIALAGLFRLRGDRTARALAAFASLVVAAYLVYAVFDDWSYLRFLLPAMAVLAVLTAIASAAFVERLPIRLRGVIVFAIVVLIATHAILTARNLGTFRLADQLERVEQVAAYVRDLPEDAVVIAGEQSGSIRYYTGRSILRWEAATPEALAASIAALETAGRPVYVVLDAFEDQLFRARFGRVAAVTLDWPPLLDAGSSHRTRVWRTGEHDRFLRGETPKTIRLP